MLSGPFTPDGLDLRYVVAMHHPPLAEAVREITAGRFVTPDEWPNDDLLAWATGLALADDERCLESAIDALRLAQAATPLARPQIDREPRDEALILVILEPRFVACGRSAEAAERRATIEALLRLDAARPSPIILHALEASRAEVGDVEHALESDNHDPMIERRERVDALRRTVEALRAVRAHEGPLAELPTPATEAFQSTLPSAFSRELFARLEIQLLVGALRTIGGEGLEGLQDPHDGSALVERGGRICSPTFRESFGRDGCVSVEAQSP